MEAKAIEIMNAHRLMAIATTRPDGWPQVTMVSYANDGLLIYFAISRHSQKFANIAEDDRVSIAIGRDFQDPRSIRALSIAAHASEVRDAAQREQAIDLILERHPGLAKLPRPDNARAAVMRALCSVVTILDYCKGFGHADVLTVGVGGPVWMEPARDDDWGFLPCSGQPTS